MRIDNALKDKGLVVGVVLATGVDVRPTSAALRGATTALLADRMSDALPPAARKEAVRALLRTGGFKPSGRSKPASEYLAQAARENRFPAINNLVDVNNYVSLASGLPISLLDAEPFQGALRLRFGREGESYVFNAAGHAIDLGGLICACSAVTDEALGNPVKDSMQGKIKDETTTVVGVIYAPRSAVTGTDLNNHVEALASWLKVEGGASGVSAQIG